MTDSLELVSAFHKAFEINEPKTPCLPGLGSVTQEALQAAAFGIHEASQMLLEMALILGEGSVVLMRAHLMAEELAEVLEATSEGNVAQALHELADLRWVTDGTVLAFGLAEVFNPMMDLLFDANMSKLGPDGKPIKNLAGRVVKGPNFKKADAYSIVCKLYKNSV